MVKKATIPAGYIYEDYPSTVSFSYIVCAMYSITSMAVAELIVRNLDLQPSSYAYSVGQIIAIIVSGATILRARSLMISWCIEGRSIPDLIFGLLWLHSTEEPERICMIRYVSMNFASLFHVG
jgi:hypothetical protein